MPRASSRTGRTAAGSTPRAACTSARVAATTGCRSSGACSSALNPNPPLPHEGEGAHVLPARLLELVCWLRVCSSGGDATGEAGGEAGVEVALGLVGVHARQRRGHVGLDQAEMLC